MALPYISELHIFVALLVSTGCIITWLGLAALAHDRRRRTVPVRIHVAGSRGKTTVTRLIGAALRQSGLRVLVKTTGTDPLLILPDGTERSWPRWGPPSISEQVRFFREARRQRADAVVLESMAIEPEYLWASEHYLVRATHAVITNVRPDHAEVVGTHPLAAANAMSLVIPRGAKLFLAEEAAVAPITGRAAANGCEVRVVAPAGQHHDLVNRALALAVSGDLGIDAETAARGLAAAGEDPGAFAMVEGEAGGRRYRFANAFSCNDPRSLEQLWQENPSPGGALFLLNIRSDRPERTRAFLSCLAGLSDTAPIYATMHVPRRWLREAGIAETRLRRLRARNARSALAELAAAAPEGATIWGVGNYSRLGRDIARHLKETGRKC